MHGRRYPARWVRALMGSLLAAACLLAGAATADAGPPARWGTLGDDVATSWRAQQNPDGTFRDYVYGGDVSFCLQASCKPGLGNARYGESVLGYSMIQTGLRVRDSGLVDSGLGAINYIVGRRDLQRMLPTAFESFSGAAA